MKRLFHTMLALSAAAALVLSFSACSNGDDDDDDTSDSTDTATEQTANASEATYTTITVTVPANVNRVQLYRKKTADENANFMPIYWRSFNVPAASAGTYTITDYFAVAGTEYTYGYKCRLVASDGTITWDKDYSGVTSVTAAAGNGALASGDIEAKYDSTTNALTFTTLPTVTTTYPDGFSAPVVRAYFYNSETKKSGGSEFTVVSEGYERNVFNDLMDASLESWFGAKLNCITYIRCTNGAGEYYVSNTKYATIAGSEDKSS